MLSTALLSLVLGKKIVRSKNKCSRRPRHRQQQHEEQEQQHWGIVIFIVSTNIGIVIHLFLIQIIAIMCAWSSSFITGKGSASSVLHMDAIKLWW
jgi:hypothetical protein